MGLIVEFADSFDHYATAQLVEKYTSFSGGSGGSISATAARNGAQGLILSGGNLVKNITQRSSYVFGIAMNKRTNNNPVSMQNHIQFRDNGNIQVAISFDASGHMIATRSNSNVVIGTSTLTVSGLLSSDFIEVGTTIHPTAGVFIAKFNGVTFLNLTGINTQGTGTVNINQFRLGDGNINAITWYDDLYLTADSVAGVLNFMGDGPVTMVKGTGAGAFADFIRGGVDTGANFSQVNIIPPVIASWNAHNVVGKRDSFVFAPIGAGTVVGAVLTALVQKDSAGSANVALKVRSSAVDNADVPIVLGTGYVFDQLDVSIDPNTAALFTRANLNAAEWGYKVV